MAAAVAGQASGAALTANTGGLHAAAGQLAAAADSLAALAAEPMIHPPLATDETSGSVAARLSEHGAVLASRASDAAAVLSSAAYAIVQAALAYAAMDAANRTVVALRGNPEAPMPSATPAITVDSVAAEVPIVPPLPRPGEVTAAMMEAGSSAAGAGFIAACGAVSQEFRGCGAAVRQAASVIGANLQGQAGPALTAALSRFADWTQVMVDHAETLGQWAASHGTQFAHTQQQTPKTAQFAASHRELAHATALFASHPGPQTAAAVTRAQTALTSLNQRTFVVAAGYHDVPAPLTPPGPPPPAPPIVTAPGPQGQSPPSPTQPSGTKIKGDGRGGDDDSGGGDDGLDDSDVDLTGDPALNPGAQAFPALASMLPSMLTGALGGVIGAASHIPQSMGQQVQGMASQAMQGLGGLSSALADPANDDRFASPAGTPDGVIPASGGGGGETAPAAAPGQLPPAATSMFAMSASPTTGLPLGSQIGGAATTVPPETSGLGGAPMMMPMGAGMGAGAGAGTRAVKEPDKTIEVPPQPNTEPVKGETVRRHTAVADDSPRPAPSGKPAAVKLSSRRRNIEVPKDGGTD